MLCHQLQDQDRSSPPRLPVQRIDVSQALDVDIAPASSLPRVDRDSRRPGNRHQRAASFEVIEGPQSILEAPGTVHVSLVTRPRVVTSFVRSAPTREAKTPLTTLLAQLPITYFHRQDRSECSICITVLTAGEAVRCLPCLHSFHQACIDQWLHTSLTCPLCKTPVRV